MLVVACWGELALPLQNNKKVYRFLHSIFKAYLEEALHNRLICGLRSESTQKRLLSEADLTFAQVVEIAQIMEAAHKNAQAPKGPELPVRQLEKLQRERGEVKRKAEVKEEGSLDTIVVKGGIYRMSVASRKPPARKEGTLHCSKLS